MVVVWAVGKEVEVVAARGGVEGAAGGELAVRAGRRIEARGGWDTVRWPQGWRRPQPSWWWPP